MIYPSTAVFPSSNTYPERVIPNFVFDDDAVLIPYKTVTSTDSATVTESVNSFVFEPRLDSLAFTENINLSVELNLFDSLIVSDQFESITFEHFDSASISDTISPLTISGPHDHLYVGESVNAALEASDSTTFADTATIGVFIEDSITVSDAVNFISFSQSDQLTATDALVAISTFVSTFDLDQTYIDFSGFVTADPPGFDHMHWNDEFDYQFIATTLSTLDDPIVSEDTPDIGIPVVDSANVSEFIQISLAGSDQLFNTDQLLSLTINATSKDQFIYQELFELTADINVNDALNITDASLLAVNAFGTQSITFGESVSISVSVSDSGNLTEVVQNSLSNSDSLQMTEKKTLSLVASELSILSDFASNSANVSKKDVASLSEGDKQISLSVTQMSHLLEIPFYHADYARLDYLFLISELASASILKEDKDYFVITEATSNVLLQGLQLITFKEKIGIGTAAPLVLNINENPTVHGSATGDIIIISTGGTEPVLL